MRQIGTLSNRAEATRFAAYLVVQGIHVQSEEDGAAWAVWVRDEDQLTTARAALAEFQADPTQDKFKGVEQSAEQRRREEAAKREAARAKRRHHGTTLARPGGRTPPTIDHCRHHHLRHYWGHDQHGPGSSQPSHAQAVVLRSGSSRHGFGPG